MFYEKPTPELEILKKELGYYPKPADFIPNPNYPEGHRWFGSKRCHAWNPKRGRQCLGLAMVSIRPDFDKCKGCGGKAKRGQESPRYKDGRSSRYKPKLPNYPAYLDDPDYLTLIDEIALVTGRLDELIETIEVGESARLWGEVRKEFQGLKKAIAKGDSIDATEKMNSLDYLILQGSKEWAKWAEITNNLEVRRKLVETERKRIESADASLRMNQAILLFDSMVAANRAVIIEKLDSIIGFDIDIRQKERILNEISRRFGEFVNYTNTNGIKRANLTS